MRARGWPVLLQDGDVVVRPMRRRDAGEWSRVRTANEQWLAPWEGRPAGAADVPWSERHTPMVYRATLRTLVREARTGRTLPCAVVHRGQLVGQVTVGNVVRGAFDSGYVGYWVDAAHAGLGITPTAVALLADHCFGPVGLHRLEANIRPDNAASRRVVEKLGFREEGLHRRYLHIDGAWRDHVAYALLKEDVPEGVLRRLRAG